MHPYMRLLGLPSQPYIHAFHQLNSLIMVLMHSLGINVDRERPHLPLPVTCQPEAKGMLPSHVENMNGARHSLLLHHAFCPLRCGLLLNS